MVTGVATYDALVDYMGTKLTYLQVLEMGRGPTAGPISQRERSLLNILAMSPKAQPLANTMGILDKSQSIARCAMRVDGNVGTMATNACMWSLADGRSLSIGEMAKLMGHDLHSMALGNITAAQFRKLLGMSVHRGVAGFLLVGLIAALGVVPKELLVLTKCFVRELSKAFDPFGLVFGGFRLLLKSQEPFKNNVNIQGTHVKFRRDHCPDAKIIYCIPIATPKLQK